MRVHQHHYGSPTWRICFARSNPWSSSGAMRACSRKLQSTMRCGSAGRTSVGETMEVKFTLCPTPYLFPDPCRRPTACICIGIGFTCQCISGPSVSFLLRPPFDFCRFQPYPFPPTVYSPSQYLDPTPYPSLYPAQYSPFSLSIS